MSGKERQYEVNGCPLRRLNRLPSKGNHFAPMLFVRGHFLDAKLVQKFRQPPVFLRQLRVRMGVAGEGEGNAELLRGADEVDMGILLANRFAPSRRADFDGEVFPADAFEQRQEMGDESAFGMP